jgi:hypothetical protein
VNRASERVQPLAASKARKGAIGTRKRVFASKNDDAATR